MSKLDTFNQRTFEKHTLFLCRCGSIEHQLIMHYWPYNTDPNDNPEVYVSVFLKPLSFWNRLKHSVKYLFGYRSRYGDFEEFIFRPSDYTELQKVVDFLKESHQKETKVIIDSIRE